MPAVTRRKLLMTTAAGASVAAFGSHVAALAAQESDLPTVSVGSKDFTESVVLAEIVALLLEDAGYPVERQLNLGGTAVVHEALVAGEVDVYVEYTGTGLLAILGMELPESAGTASASPAAGATPATGVGQDPVYNIVATEYAERFQVEWLEPWGFNNTYALAMRSDHADELGVETISDLEGLAGDLVFGATQEFLVREDGLPGIEELYGLEFSDTVGLDPGLMYSALADGDVDVISAFATDGRIPALNLTLLKDDKNFFPPYYAAPVVRQELLDASPEVADILNQLAGEITDEEMADLNFQVDDGGKEAIEVAREYLVGEGLISE